HPVAALLPLAGTGLPAVPRDAASARLAQDYLGLKKSYSDLTARLQSAELQKQTIGSGKVDSFRILDRANLPEVPAWPNRRLLGLLAAAISLGLGILIFLAVEVKRFATLQDSRDVEFYTQLPLLASIPRALTAPEHLAERRRSRLRYLGVTVAASVGTFALAELLMLSHLFELFGRK
ncbi:MAG TPA: hypothetical protein VEZ90_00500, partial [Blastocatellia bacterium]|nr:hypothetical protein [Blastocatellia bacterium]